MSWNVAHAEIDGVIIDREKGWPKLHVEMHPIGLALHPDDQSRELHLKIGDKETVIDADGIIYLTQFLIESHRP